MARIMLLRRDESSLSDSERSALASAFPGQGLTFVRADPVDYHEHAVNCQREKPDVVLLPLERPIPSQAMDEGFRHVAIRDGTAFELMPLDPQFVPFQA